MPKVLCCAGVVLRVIECERVERLLVQKANRTGFSFVFPLEIELLCCNELDLNGFMK